MRRDEYKDEPGLTDEVLSTPLAEAYRQLRVSLGFLTASQPVKKILVTSGAQGEGKTTTAVNLGIIVAEAGSRVLLVDANLRRPALHQLLGWSVNGRRQPPGLSNLLSGQAQLANVISPSGLPGVSLLPAGPVPPNPNELLGSIRMEEVMSQLEGSADLILLDSPALRSYADALLLSPLVDGVLYVIRSGRQDQSTHRRVRKQLHQARARLLGVVFNDADSGEATSDSPGHPFMRIRPRHYRSINFVEQS